MIERMFEENDLQSLLDLLGSSFDGWHDFQYWTWKYEKNPHGSPVIWVAEDKGSIVGCYILNPVNIRIGRVLVRGAQSVDAAVDKAYRGAGIFKRLAVNAIAQATKEGVALIYAFPTEIAHKGQVHIGYRPMFVVPKMFRVFNPRSLVEEKSSKGFFLQKSLSVMQPFRRIGEAKIRFMPSPELKVSEISDFDSRFEAFWKEISKKNKSILIERDPSYLRWRYLAHPENNYTAFVCEKDGEIAGYAVVSIERHVSMERGETGQLSIGNIIDLQTLPNMINTAFPLISASCNLFKHEGVDIARCWMFRWHPYHSILHKFRFSEYYELLRRVAFRPRYNEQLICCLTSKTTIHEAIRLMPHRGNPCWFIMQGDADFM